LKSIVKKERKIAWRYPEKHCYYRVLCSVHQRRRTNEGKSDFTKKEVEFHTKPSLFSLKSQVQIHKKAEPDFTQKKKSPIS